MRSGDSQLPVFIKSMVLNVKCEFRSLLAPLRIPPFWTIVSWERTAGVSCLNVSRSFLTFQHLFVISLTELVNFGVCFRRRNGH